ncbi:hypothetical protein A6A08_20330 [Nocardiopsis sp. TSRI0078]|uniref:hypothetical protein n=1 Tax=unclassified Nocardiopsis TaxID=2649073 RepID=UPI00093D0221|nr:hypothetical protein [Nocardiopsis sp. TSRI0078]OKI21934.1 hypothetical protein A6A08_20330 [Nocardiopsis sp. TSRI0078]
MTRPSAPRALVDFDSSVNMVRALGRFLRGKDHRGMSVGPSSRALAAVASSPPYPVRRSVFGGMGMMQGLPLDQVRRLRAERLAEWVTRQYGPGPHPAVVIGSASGAAVHLAAALRAPFLPQTLLVGARDIATHPDDPVGAMEALTPLAGKVAQNNPELSVYQMHDPAQDRPMLENMAYLRLKWRHLSHAYERFIEERLAPDAPVIQLECTRDWRTREMAERTYFQFGCLGGVSEEEYHRPGEGIAEYLADEGSSRRTWEPPTADARRPEAEWGFDPAITPHVRVVAERGGHPVRRLVTGDPQELSPFVADLYRWWYRRREVSAGHLLVQSYVQWDPLWTLRLGAVPFWLRFNMEPSHEELRRYLEDTEPYDHIHLNLFSQGLWSPGVVPLSDWEELIRSHAREGAEIIGVDPATYPSDTGGTLRYQRAFQRLPRRRRTGEPLAVADIDEFLGDGRPNYRMQWH